MPTPRPGLCRPSLASATARRRGSESTPGGASTSRCARGRASLPQGSLAPVRVLLSQTLIAYYDPIRQSRGHAATSRTSRLYATPSLGRERRGGPRDLPYFRCCAFHTCRRPYAGGSEAPTRYVCAPIPGSLVLSLSCHPRHPPLPAIPGGVMPFRRCIVRVMLRPARLPSPPDWLRRRNPWRRLLRTVSPPLLTRPVAMPR